MKACYTFPKDEALLSVFEAEQSELPNGRGYWNVACSGTEIVVEITTTDVAAMRALSNAVLRLATLNEKVDGMIGDLHGRKHEKGVGKASNDGAKPSDVSSVQANSE